MILSNGKLHFMVGISSQTTDVTAMLLWHSFICKLNQGEAIQRPEFFPIDLWILRSLMANNATSNSLGAVGNLMKARFQSETKLEDQYLA